MPQTTSDYPFANITVSGTPLIAGSVPDGNPVSPAIYIAPVAAVFLIGVIVLVFIRRFHQKRNSGQNFQPHAADLEVKSTVPLALVGAYEGTDVEYKISRDEVYAAARPRSLSKDSTKPLPGELPCLVLEQPAIHHKYGAKKNMTVSQYIDPTLLAPSQFSRMDPCRRSNSLGSLASFSKMNTMRSQDSGFASEMSLPQSPGTPDSTVHFTDASSGHIADASLFMKSLIEDEVRMFRSIPDRVIGTCYSSRIFAIGEFDRSGGILILDGCEQVRLVIPPGALRSPQLVYFMMQFENNDSGDTTANFSPTFECGPDGLKFEVPVELTFPHTAVDTEVTAVSKEKHSTWSETNKNGPEISMATPDTVTLKIHHFTGFKLSASRDPHSVRSHRSCHSRIPVRVQSAAVERQPLNHQPGKRLLVSVFKCGDKARIYFINSLKSTDLDRMIDHQEASLQFVKDSPWKEFTFLLGKGGLIIESSTIHGANKKVYRKFNFIESKVLSAQYEYVEIVAAERVLLLDILFYQPHYRQNNTQFSVKLEKPSSPLQSVVSEQYWHQLHLQQLSSLMKDLHLYQAPQQYLHSNSYPTSQLHDTSRPYGRSVSDNESIRCNSSRQPQEHCEHGGACNCFMAMPRSPVESEWNGSITQMNGMKRGIHNRSSKESGYGSSVQSPVSPLKGPESLSGNDSMVADGSSSDLTLNTVSSQSWSATPQNYVQNTKV